MFPKNLNVDETRPFMGFATFEQYQKHEEIVNVLNGLYIMDRKIKAEVNSMPPRYALKDLDIFVQFNI
jgi:hypothetical protein